MFNHFNLPFPSVSAILLQPMKSTPLLPEFSISNFSNITVLQPDVCIPLA